MPGHHPALFYICIYYWWLALGFISWSVGRLWRWRWWRGRAGNTPLVPSYCPFLWNIVELIVHSSFMFPVQVSKAAGTSSAGDCGKSRTDSFEVNSAAWCQARQGWKLSLCCPMLKQSIYILTNGNIHKVSDMCPVLPAWFSIAEWAQRLLQRSFYTLVQTLQDRIPLMTWSSSATSGYIWNLDLIVNPCCDRLRFQKYTPALLHRMVLATDPNMGPQMHHHFASLCAHYLYGTM